jgi:hypothetical protein
MIYFLAIEDVMPELQSLGEIMVKHILVDKLDLLFLQMLHQVLVKLIF